MLALERSRGPLAGASASVRSSAITVAAPPSSSASCLQPVLAPRDQHERGSGSRARRLAVASPIPLEAPVIRATYGSLNWALSTGAQAYPVRLRSLLVSESTIALITVPIVTGVIGYTTNWTGVLMLFYPVHFRGWRARWLQSLARAAAVQASARSRE